MPRKPVYYIIPVAILLWTARAQAQEADSLQASISDTSYMSAIPPAHCVMPIKPTADFDQRFYYIQNRRANVWGYRVGVLIKDKYKLGIGGYYMNEAVTPVADPHLAVSRTSSDYNHRQRLYLGTVYYEPYITRREYWESSVVFEAGYGRSVNLSTDAVTGEVADKQNKAFVPAGIGLSVSLKLPPLFGWVPMHWLGINAMAGYRQLLYKDADTYNYDGVYWSLSGAIFLDRIAEDIHCWKERKEGRKSGNNRW